ncbi:acyl-CoA dehydrogenase [Acetobacteraceae bacterium H6797]|nr:acyl-CoA dehydrogenase [Acetobacteraceae bacterium H6797]
MDMIDSGLNPAEFATTAERAVAACATLDGAGRAARLAEDGILGLLAGEEVGGLGLGLPFAVPVLAAAGAGDLAFPLLETLLLTRALEGVLPEIAEAFVTGGARGTIAWQGKARLVGGKVSGMLGRAPMAGEADWVLVRLADGGAALVSTEGAKVSKAVTLDVTVSEENISFDGAEPKAKLDAPALAVLENDALVLRAAVIMGAADTCIALAAEHVGNRKQFGKPLVAYQAVRHLLARHKLGLEGIRGAVTRATATQGLTGEELLTASRAAFLAAATHGPSIGEGAIQLFGGMGFTWEVPVHRYLRRIRALEAQGAAPALREAVAAALIDAA